MPSKILEMLGVKVKNNELEEMKINLSSACGLEIIIPFLLTRESLTNLLYSLHSKFDYLFGHLDYSIKVQSLSEVNKDVINDYLFLVCATPFLWKNKEDLFFFLEHNKILEEFTFRKNNIYLHIDSQHLPLIWRDKLATLKKILLRLGLSNINFILKNKNKSEIAKKNKENIVNNDRNSSKTNSENTHKINKNISVSVINEKKLSKLSLLKEWKGRKVYEFGVHTKFSTLDGISSPFDYIEEAKQKNYSAIAVTDHYNVQSFPEFSKHQEKNLKIIYGCELEMLEDEISPYIFNNNSWSNQELCKKKITELTYCVFDLETTGFFSEYNEIIELGYVIWKDGKIQQAKEYLICPKKEISPEVLANWYTSIDPQELKKASKIEEILPTLQKEWKDCILVAHNARKFDYGFLNKVWKQHLGKELPYPVIDTLPLSWMLLPKKKSYSLEKLSNISGRNKISQTHRALDDSKLLTELLERLINIIREEKINYWKEVKELSKDNYFSNRGYKVKVLASSQEGLYNLYRLITISHTKRLFKKPSVLRSDLEKHRSGLLIGASGAKEGEIFSLFSSFNFEETKKKKLCFYDYIEVNSPETFRHLWLNGLIREAEIKEMTKKIIRTSENLKIPVVASHHIYYCKKKERLLKEIIIANEGMNGSRHYLYNEATSEGKKDHFSSLPPQHLPSLEEIIGNWSFLGDKNLIHKIIFEYPQMIVKKVGEINIKQPPLNYSITESNRSEENDLISAYTQQAKKIFGDHWPDFVKERIEKEWKIIKGRYVFIYWLAYKIVQKTHQDGSLVGSRGSIGSSFIAYLCGITDLNPLPFYKFCPKCRYTEAYKTQDRIYCCYDYRGNEKCPNCSSLLTMEGHNLPFETFFGWEGEKTPDIDLNFSGEYQKIAHNYVRQLLGEESVYRIGTINTLSQQTAEIFWREHLKLRKKLSPDFNEERWFKEWADSEKLKELEKKLNKLYKEKNQLETGLKKLEDKNE